MYQQPFYNPQVQALQQRLNQFEMPQQQPQKLPPVVYVADENEASRVQVDVVSGQPVYCVFGNEIIVRQWDIAKGGVTSKRFLLQDDITSTPEQKDRLKSIEDTLQEILKKVSVKKAVKDAE